MRTFRRAMLTSLLGVFLLPAMSLAQTSSVKVLEQEPGLLTQAKTQPAAAIATASAQIPGAQLISTEIERHQNRLIYLIDFRLPGKDGIQHVQIDASNGQVITVEHHAEIEQPGGHLLVLASPEGLERAKIDFATAAQVALDQVPSSRIVFSRIREQASKLVYAFDIEPQQRRGPVRVVIDANTGLVVTVQAP